MTQIFLNAAELVDLTGCFSCTAIHNRAGHGFSNATRRYKLMFDPYSYRWYPPNYTHDATYFWWNSQDNPTTRVARVFALLLAHEMHRTGDL